MKNKMKKLKITTFCLLLVFMLAGCGNNIANLSPQPMPEYPSVGSTGGYTINGVATDTKGNPLEGVQLKIADKVYAITDETGSYQISGLSGSHKIKPMFYDYEFTQGEFEVSDGGTFDLNGTNAKKYMITFDTYSSHQSGAELFGVVYEINGKNYSGDDNQKAFLEDLTGKVTITPSKEGFEFSPTSMDVYSTTNVKFTATPTSDRYSVSGTIDISSYDEEDYIQTVEMYVDGKLATHSYIDYSYSQDGKEKRTMKYQIDGLDKSKTTGHQISYKVGGTDSIQKITVTQSTDTADFKYYITKSVDVKFEIDGIEDETRLPQGHFFDFDIRIYDEDGTFVKKYSGRDLVEEDIVIWRGAKLEITGLYKAPDGDEGTEMKAFDQTDKITESDMRKEYLDGEYFEIRVRLKTYREDD